MYTDFHQAVNGRLQCVLQGEQLQDFAFLSSMEFTSREVLETFAKNSTLHLIQVRKALAESGYSLRPFTISQFSDKHDAAIKDIDEIMLVAPEPWLLRAKVHFRRCSKELGETIKVDSFLEIRSGKDVVYRKHIVEKVGAKNE